MNYQRLISSVGMLLLAGMTVFVVWQFWEVRQEYAQVLREENKLRVTLAAQQETLRENQRTLERLRTDPQFVDQVIRRRLGYAKPGELIFRFEQTDAPLSPLPAPSAANDR